MSALWRRRWFCVFLGLGLFLGGCSGTSVSHVPNSTRRAGPIPKMGAGSRGTGEAVSGTLAVFPEPASGYGMLMDSVLAAKKSVDVVLYELGDQAFEEDLAKVAARGVVVRVLLDRAYHGGRFNQGAASFLSAHDVAVRFAPSDVILHEKAVIVDAKLAWVMSSNIIGAYLANSANWVIRDAQPADVAEITAAFDEDWHGDLNQPARRVSVRGLEDGNLLFSPEALSGYLDLIKSATRSLWVSAVELDQPEVISALARAAKDGVSVRLLMTNDPKWDDALSMLEAAGVKVRLYPDIRGDLYIHAKTLVINGDEALVGSQNISTASLVYNRELSVLLKGSGAQGLVQQVMRTYQAWWAGAPSA
jgi:cardiolipin synthase